MLLKNAHSLNCKHQNLMLFSLLMENMMEQLSTLFSVMTLT